MLAKIRVLLCTLNDNFYKNIFDLSTAIRSIFGTKNDFNNLIKSYEVIHLWGPSKGENFCHSRELQII